LVKYDKIYVCGIGLLSYLMYDHFGNSYNLTKNSLHQPGTSNTTAVDVDDKDSVKNN